MWLFRKRNSAGDEDLARKYFHTGDKALVGDLFERHVKTVFGVCLFYFRDKDMAKDAVMQIFERLITDLRKTEINNFKAWLTFVARNYCISELRKRKGKYFLPETYLDFEINETSLDEEERIAKINEEQLLDHMKECLPKIKENQRICVEAFYLNGKSYQEISNENTFSINEVKSYIQNGKRNLKLLIEAEVKKQKDAA